MILYDRAPDTDVVAIEYLTQAARLALLEEEEGFDFDVATEGEIAEAEKGEAGNDLSEPAEGNDTSSVKENTAINRETSASDELVVDVERSDQEAATTASGFTNSEPILGPDPSLAQEVFDFTVVNEETALSRILAETSWVRVVRISLLLSLVMVAFLLKSEALRWVTLAVTLLYLGFWDGGFLSVSHITSGIWVGASVYLGD